MRAGTDRVSNHLDQTVSDLRAFAFTSSFGCNFWEGGTSKVDMQERQEQQIEAVYRSVEKLGGRMMTAFFIPEAQHKITVHYTDSGGRECEIVMQREPNLTQDRIEELVQEAMRNPTLLP